MYMFVVHSIVSRIRTAAEDGSPPVDIRNVELSLLGRFRSWPIHCKVVRNGNGFAIRRWLCESHHQWDSDQLGVSAEGWSVMTIVARIETCPEGSRLLRAPVAARGKPGPPHGQTGPRRFHRRPTDEQITLFSFKWGQR
jgi:hypothetical protein